MTNGSYTVPIGSRRAPVRQPHCCQDQEQVLLGDPQFDMLPGRRHAPTLGAGELGVAKHVVAGVAVEHTAAVHPRPEIGGHRDVRAGGDNVLGQLAAQSLPPPDLGQDVAEALLGAVLAPR